MKTETTRLPWALEAWGAILSALYHLEVAPENDQERIRRAIEILKECGPPTKGETDV